MRTLSVDSAVPYEVLIGSGLISSAGPRLKAVGGSSMAVIITNTTVNELYGLPIKKSLLNEDFETVVLEIPDTEKSKSITIVSNLYDELVRYKIERTTPIIALGGGVVGDVAGFVAATFLRGLPFVQIPTTLIAQVDSSIGGKTGVNHGGVKNMVGAFKDPVFVLTDPTVLNTLPQEEVRNGAAEIIKYAAIADRSLFALLEKRMNDLFDLCSPLERVVERCCMIKAGIVQQDRKEQGLRMILNYGHTVGHSVEAVKNFEISHGEAVSIGMCAAARIAHKMGIFNLKEVKRQEKLIDQAGLPTKLPDIDIDSLLQTMHHDKKVQNSRIHFVLPKKIGSAVVRNDVPEKILEETLEDLK
ncbi:MAG: 3-dehydroquinate synthase [Euryarchaeota archaeon]|nr:3-dehydroquinate synthase [Euryarchaeota archaeon]